MYVYDSTWEYIWPPFGKQKGAEEGKDAFSRVSTNADYSISPWPRSRKKWTLARQIIWKEAGRRWSYGPSLLCLCFLAALWDSDLGMSAPQPSLSSGVPLYILSPRHICCVSTQKAALVTLISFINLSVWWNKIGLLMEILFGHSTKESLSGIYPASLYLCDVVSKTDSNWVSYQHKNKQLVGHKKKIG